MITFHPWDEAVANLPEAHAAPDWDRRVHRIYREYLDKYCQFGGLVSIPDQAVVKSEVCCLDGLPILQQHTDFLQMPSSWMLDAQFSSNQYVTMAQLVQCAKEAGARWQRPVDVPCAPATSGQLVGKLLNLGLPFKSKQRNEQAQARKLHGQYRVEQVFSIPYEDVVENFNYWVSTGSSIYTQAASYALSAACAIIGHGFIFKVTTELGFAYCGFTSLGKSLTLTSFCQLGRAPRMGTMALAVVDEYLRATDLCAQHGYSQSLILSLPRFQEDLGYATYKGHVSNEDLLFGSLYAYHAEPGNRPIFCGDREQWT